MMALDYKFTAKDLISKGRILEKDIETIKEFINGLDEKCVPKCIPEEFIGTILVACSNDVDLTKQTIVAYFKVKKMSPSLFDNRNIDDEDLQLAERTTSTASIHWPEENTEVIYVKIRDTNYRNCYMEPQLKFSNMVIDSVHVTNPPDGIIIVQDMQGFGLMHITRLKLDSLKIFFTYVQDALPVQLKSIHYVNSNYVLNKIMPIFRLFMKPELYSKIHFHRGTEGLSDYIPKRYTPCEFGGELSSIEDHHIHLVKKLKGMETYWREEEALRKQCFLDG